MPKVGKHASLKLKYPVCGKVERQLMRNADKTIQADVR